MWRGQFLLKASSISLSPHNPKMHKGVASLERKCQSAKKDNPNSPFHFTMKHKTITCFRLILALYNPFGCSISKVIAGRIDFLKAVHEKKAPLEEPRSFIHSSGHPIFNSVSILVSGSPIHYLEGPKNYEKNPKK